jgi:hypothetical protein
MRPSAGSGAKLGLQAIEYPGIIQAAAIVGGNAIQNKNCVLVRLWDSDAIAQRKKSLTPINTVTLPLTWVAALLTLHFLFFRTIFFLRSPAFPPCSSLLVSCHSDLVS